MRGVRRRCAALLAAAILLRGAAALWTGGGTVRPAGADLRSFPAGAAADRPARQLPALRFRDVPEEDTPEEIPVETPEKAVREGGEVPSFTAEDAAGIVIGGNCTLDYDKEALLLAPPPETERLDGPQVLIVHTHTTEAYTKAPGWDYEETEPCRTLDPDYSVVRLGSELAALLEARGIGVLHDTTVQDYPSYSGSYDRTAETISAYLAEYPSIRMVLDVHRDAFEAADGTLGGTAADGRARIMLVVGTDERGLTHPNWQGNLSFALKLETLLRRRAPGLSRGISLCAQRYNQNLTPLSLLAEFGAAGDTLEEALAAVPDFAAALAELLAM